MRQRWLSSRAFLLHAAIVIWFPGCLVAFWWQVHRALSGNGLSYVYSVEWPLFALAGAWAWWQLLHTDPESVGRRAQERIAADARRTAPPPSQRARPVREDEDPELAAYNARLARLADEGPKTWRRR